MGQALENFYTTARAAGCPMDQVQNFVRGGVVLQPKQLRAAALARACDRSEGPVEIGYGGARGGGKSFLWTAQCGVDDSQRYPGLKTLLLRKVGKAGKESFDDLRRHVLMGLKHDYSRTAGVVTFDNGSRIITGHFQRENDIDSYLGLEYDEIIVEEATTLSAKKYKDISTCNRTSKPGWRPRIYSSANPGGVGHAWYKAKFITPYQLRQEVNTRFLPATVRDNRMVNAEYVGVLERLTGWEKRAWLEGDWDIQAGQFFTTFRRNAHVIKPISPDEIPSNWTLWASLDYGFTHYTVIYLLARDSDGVVYVLDEHAERKWLVARHAGALQTMLRRWDIPLERIETVQAGNDCFAKRHTGTTIASEYSAYGVELSPANDDRIQGAAEILRALSDPDAGMLPQLKITEKCPRLIECLPAMMHDPNRPEDVLKIDADDDGIGGDDPYDSLRYGLMYKPGRAGMIKVR
jgi:phage terminase large subunit